MSTKRDQQGISLIEVIVVSFLLTVVLSVLVSAVVMAIARNRVAKERVVATRLAQEGVEWLRFQRDVNGFGSLWTFVNGWPDGSYSCINIIPDALVSFGEDCAGTDLLDGKFKRRITFTNVGIDSMHYIITVSWPRSGAVNDEVRLEGDLTQWER